MTTVTCMRNSRENYYRFSCLIVENTRNALVCIFEFGLSDTKHCSYEEFLNQNQHVVYSRLSNMKNDNNFHEIDDRRQLCDP
jgi:hypothetical protein